MEMKVLNMKTYEYFLYMSINSGPPFIHGIQKRPLNFYVEMTSVLNLLLIYSNTHPVLVPKWIVSSILLFNNGILVVGDESGYIYIYIYK